VTAILILSALASLATVFVAAQFDMALAPPRHGSWVRVAWMLLAAGAAAALLSQPAPLVGLVLPAAVTVAVGVWAGRWPAVAFAPCPYLGVAVVVAVLFHSQGDPAAVLTLVLVAPVASGAAAVLLAVSVACRSAAARVHP
jgi:hypothetical protein